VTDRRNLTGAWFGTYSYLGDPRDDVSFVASLEEVVGMISGSISEPNTIGESSDQLGAVVRGHRDGGEVTFTKIYDGASDAAHAVQYAGTVSDDGTRLSGFWQLEDLSGSFVMTRTHAEEELEAEIVEDVQQPALLQR
jgi:hypothetical protein